MLLEGREGEGGRGDEMRIYRFDLSVYKYNKFYEEYYKYVISIDTQLRIIYF